MLFVDLSQILPFCHLNDEDFDLALYEQQFGCIRFNHDRLDNLKFNPLLSEIHVKHLSLCNDNDPDNFYQTFKCEYYIEDKFNDIFIQDRFSEKHLSVPHLNIRSLSKNFEKLTDLLSTIKLNISMIGISETWLKESDHVYNIQGYNFIHEVRKNQKGGGVGLYLRYDYKFKCRPDLCFSNQSAESLFIEIIRNKEKNMIVGVIYRPPDNNVRELCDELEKLLVNISSNNKLCVLIADWNLDLLKHNRHRPTAEFLDIMYSKMFFPLITRPTRITSHTATLLDNIFINSLDSVCNSGLLFSDISDHLPIFSILSVKIDCANKDSWFTYRENSSINMQMFREKLQQYDWKDVSENNDPCHAYRAFLNKLTLSYNMCFPVKRVRNRKHVRLKPWITECLLKYIKKKNVLFKKFACLTLPITGKLL